MIWVAISIAVAGAIATIYALVATWRTKRGMYQEERLQYIRRARCL